MNSAIYTGTVRHRRFAVRPHAFRYGLFMVYLDLDELDQVFRGSWLWTTRGWGLAQFRRRDHVGDPQTPLKDTIRQLVQAQLGFTPSGAVGLLTHLRYFGYCFNPLSIYYCFGAAEGDEPPPLEAIVAEVTNTPWGERIAYCLDVRHQGRRQHSRFQKQMHVSPFMPMDQQYQWRSTAPGERLAVHLSLWQSPEDGAADLKTFDATLSLRREPITPGRLRALLFWRFPLMTLQVIATIHWEAMRLWWRGVPLHNHPTTPPPTAAASFPATTLPSLPIPASAP